MCAEFYSKQEFRIVAANMSIRLLFVVSLDFEGRDRK